MSPSILDEQISDILNPNQRISEIKDAAGATDGPSRAGPPHQEALVTQGLSRIEMLLTSAISTITGLTRLGPFQRDPKARNFGVSSTGWGTGDGVGGLPTVIPIDLGATFFPTVEDGVMRGDAWRGMRRAFVERSSVYWKSVALRSSGHEPHGRQAPVEVLLTSHARLVLCHWSYHRRSRPDTRKRSATRYLRRPT